MTNDIRYHIDKFKNFVLCENKDMWYDIDDKLRILKSYIHILNNSGDGYDLMERYFIVLHNYLIVEREFYADVVMASKEINKYLKLKKARSLEDVVEVFNELYDIYGIVRNNVETLDSIDSVSNYLSKRPEIFHGLIKK